MIKLLCSVAGGRGGNIIPGFVERRDSWSRINSLNLLLVTTIPSRSARSSPGGFYIYGIV